MTINQKTEHFAVEYYTHCFLLLLFILQWWFISRSVGINETTILVNFVVRRSNAVEQITEQIHCPFETNALVMNSVGRTNTKFVV